MNLNSGLSRSTRKHLFSSSHSRTISAITVGLVALGLIILIPARMWSQVSGATLSGTVTDTSGATVPQVQISVTNTATGVSATTPSNSDGFYSVPNLLPGSYEVKATAPGFSTAVRTGITLTVGAQQVLNLTLAVGQITQTVQVTTEAPTVELASSTIGGVLGSTTVVELPLNGRSWTDLATLQPGVNAMTTQMSYTSAVDRGLRGFGTEMTISGARPQQNNYRLDGISMNDYANGGPGSVLGGNLGVDAIQEFSVLTTNYSAEYGKTAGGVVNAVTRSGTDQFHGSAYEFLRNSALDARNFFDGPVIPEFRRNQFGASAGGPIQKDRTFIFGDYEGIRQAKGISSLDIVPSADARTGLLHYSTPTPPAHCTAISATECTVPVDPSVQKYLPLFPMPNSTASTGNPNSGFFSFAGNQIVREDFFTIRLDHQFSQKDKMFASYVFDMTPFSAPDAMDNVLKSSKTFHQQYTLEETHIFSPTFVNTVRFGFSRVAADVFIGLSPINPVAADATLSAEPGRDAASVIISGGNFTALPGGVLAPSSSTIRWNSFQGYDDAFLTKGTHSIKFGFAVERMQLNRVGASLPGGVFTFASLQNFLTNIPKKYQSGLITTLTERGYRQTLLGGYLQDDWRWRSNVTLNLGLRYEMVTVPSEVQGKLDNLPTISSPTQTLGNSLFKNPTLRNFEPRVGFAWDPFKNGKTAVRGGFGLFDSLPLLYQVMLIEGTSAPFFEKGTISGANLPPGSFYATAAGNLKGTGLQSSYYDSNPHRNYVMQWNLNVQREITPTLTALIGYVGSRGVHMPFEVDDLDMVLPTLTSAGYLFPSPIGSGTKLNTNFGSINGMFYKGNSFYDALLVGVNKTLSHGVQFQTSFTWSKSIDTSSATMQGDQFTNGITSLDWFAPSLTRGPSDFNVPRTLAVSVTWLVPTAKSLTGPAAFVVNGWTLGGILKLSDGMPWTPTFGTGSDPQGIGNSDDYAFPNRLGGAGCNSLVNPGNPNDYVKIQCFTAPTAPSQAFYNANCDPTVGDPTKLQCFNLRGNAGRNIIPGPGITDLDFSLFKDNYIKRISETFKVQFRAEVFNILNHPNFGDPVIGTGAGDVLDANGAPIPAAGVLTTTTTDSREIQFALKFVW
jgi:hypothetical protein